VGEEALRELRSFGPPAADFFEPTTYAEFQSSLDDPPGYRNYWTAEHLEELSDAAIDAISRRAAEIPASPSQLFIVPWGGAVSRIGPESSPLAGRGTAFVVHPLLLWEDAANDQRMLDLGRAFRADLAPFASGVAYLNFLGDEGADRVRAGFEGDSFARLARVKEKWDPDGVFAGNQSLA